MPKKDRDETENTKELLVWQTRIKTQSHHLLPGSYQIETMGQRIFNCWWFAEWFEAHGSFFVF